MAFQYKRAVRENTHLLIGLVGADGSGKTFSAMELATGICGSEPFLLIDTESCRGLHYAEQYDFEHKELQAPFHPAKYLEQVRAGAERGFRCIVVDSISDEWEGEGGVLEQAAADPKKSPGNWIEPKRGHFKMVNGFLQARTSLIFCLRAQEKLDLSQHDKLGKVIIGSSGWLPICEKGFMYKMTARFTLNPLKPGVVDMALPHKLQDQHRMVFPPDQHISIDAGRMLGAWARGEAIDQPDKELWHKARQAAHEGMDSLRKFAGELHEMDRNKLKPIRQELLVSGNRADRNLVADDFKMDAAWWAQTFEALRLRLRRAIGEEEGDAEYGAVLKRFSLTPGDFGDDENRLREPYNTLAARTVKLEGEKQS